MNAEQITLKAAGTELVLTIQSCGQVPVGTYPEIGFIGVDAHGKMWDYRMPKVAADRQLGRQNLTYATVVGRVVCFSRDANTKDPSKPYHGLTLLGTDVPAPANDARPDAPAPSGPAPAPHPADRVTADAASSTTTESADLYVTLTRDTLGTIVPLYAAAGIVIDMTAVAAIVNTRYINARRGY